MAEAHHRAEPVDLPVADRPDSLAVLVNYPAEKYFAAGFAVQAADLEAGPAEHIVKHWVTALESDSAVPAPELRHRRKLPFQKPARNAETVLHFSGLPGLSCPYLPDLDTMANLAIKPPSRLSSLDGRNQNLDVWTMKRWRPGVLPPLEAKSPDLWAGYPPRQLGLGRP